MQAITISRDALATTEQDLAYLLGDTGHLIRFEPARPAEVVAAKDWCTLADLRRVVPVGAETIRVGIVPMREVSDCWDRADLDVLIVHGAAYGPVRDGRRTNVRGVLVEAPRSFPDLAA